MAMSGGSRWLRMLAVAGALAALGALLPGCGSSGGWDATKGQVTVTLPADAAAAGARWMIDNDPTPHASGETVGNLELGNHTIRYTSVPGFNAPADAVVPVNTAGTPTPVTVTYTAWDTTKGSVTVTILPADAVTKGAKWTLDAETQQRTSGESVGNLTVGNHTVKFTAVTGYATPADQTVAVVAGQTATVSVTYGDASAGPGSIKVTITPSAAAAGAKWTYDSDTTQHSSGETVTNVPAGAHTVKFTDVAGFTKPADQAVTVTGGQTAEVTGAYTQPGSGPAIARFSTGNYTAGTAFQVTIVITAAIGAQGWAAEDKVPTGWTAANVSGGGTWDAVNGKMKWVSTDTIDASNQTKTVVYSVTPPAGATGTATFVGTYSSGGTPVAITGDRVIAP